jgi:hypothetical protein
MSGPVIALHTYRPWPGALEIGDNTSRTVGTTQGIDLIDFALPNLLGIISSPPSNILWKPRRGSVIDK